MIKMINIKDEITTDNENSRARNRQGALVLPISNRQIVTKTVKLPFLQGLASALTQRGA